MSTAAGASARIGAGRVRRPSRMVIRRNVWGYIFISPAILGFLLWTLGPMLVSLGLGFTQWDMLGTPRWIGLENYRRMLTGTDYQFWQSVKVTALYTALSVPW